MYDPEKALQVYQDLADSFDRQQNPGMRDVFLTLAADAALRAGDESEAERLRQRLLRLSPHHLLRPYASFSEAASFPDISSYLEELRDKYPPEAGEEMLDSIMPLAPMPPADEPATMPPRGRPRPRASSMPAADDDIPGTLPPTERRRREGAPSMPAADEDIPGTLPPTERRRREGAGPRPIAESDTPATMPPTDRTELRGIGSSMPSADEDDPPAIRLPTELDTSEEEPEGPNVLRVHPEIGEAPAPPPRPPAKPERPARKPAQQPPPRRSVEDTMPPRTAMPRQPAAPPPRPAPRPPATPGPPTTSRPVPPRRPPAPLPEPPRTAKRPEPKHEEEKGPTGAWVGTLLFVLLFVLGLALTLVAMFPEALSGGLFSR